MERITYRKFPQLPLPVSFFLLVMVCCDQAVIYQGFHVLPEGQWHRDSTLLFPLRAPEGPASYSLILHLRNQIGYPYHNLHCRYTVRSSSDSVLLEGTVEVDLFDAITGKPHGWGLGPVFDTSNPLANVDLPEQGDYTLELDQFMRTESLQGVDRVGIRMEHRSP